MNTHETTLVFKTKRKKENVAQVAVSKQLWITIHGQNLANQTTMPHTLGEAPQRSWSGVSCDFFSLTKKKPVDGLEIRLL